MIKIRGIEEFITFMVVASAFTLLFSLLVFSIYGFAMALIGAENPPYAQVFANILLFNIFLVLGIFLKELFERKYND